MKRLASRRVCVDCGANYSTAAPPLVNWTCDVCGGEVIQRQDDTEEAIERRLNLYEEETAPLLDWYKKRELLVEINGTGSPDAVTRRVVGAIDAMRHRRSTTMRRNAEELAKMRRAGKVVAEMHEATRAAAAPGVTTVDLDKVAREVLERRGATSNFLGYHGFPAVICTSPNSMIVHGIPGSYVLEEGDIISIDCGAIIEGYHGDAAFTMGIGSHLQGGAEAARGDRAQPLGRDRPAGQGQGAPRGGPGRAERGRGRRLQRGPRVRRPRHRHGHARAAPGPQLLARQQGPDAQDGQRLRHRAHGQRRRRPRPCCSTTAGAWSRPTGGSRRTSSTPSP